MRFTIACALVAVTAACSPPSPQPQPEEMDTVNATYVDEGAPTGALGNESVNYGEGNITPAERNGNQQQQQQAQAPEQVAARYANAIVQRDFGQAYRMWDPNAAGFTQEQLEQEFDRFETIQAAIGETSGSQSSASSNQQDIQLTLSGTRTDGTEYVVTGPVTLARSAGGAEGWWKVVKTVLVSNPETADALVDPRGTGSGGR